MATILHIETATNICSVALSYNEKILALKETEKANTHTELTTVFIQEVLAEANVDINLIDAVAVSMGPGSYTGLRIGVSVAKGLCYALEKPLISVGTLTSMAHGAMQQFTDRDNTTLFCPMLDARRMEVYYAMFTDKLEIFRTPQAEIMTEKSFEDLLYDHKIIMFGDGMNKCRSLFENCNKVSFLDNFLPSAKFMIMPALKKFNEHLFENTAYFEPFYLKDFIAGTPNVKGLK